MDCMNCNLASEHCAFSVMNYRQTSSSVSLHVKSEQNSMSLQALQLRLQLAEASAWRSFVLPHWRPSSRPSSVFFHCLNIFKGVPCNNGEISAHYLRRAIVSSCWFNHVWTEQLLKFRMVWRHLELTVQSRAWMRSADPDTHTHTQNRHLAWHFFSAVTESNKSYWTWRKKNSPGWKMTGRKSDTDAHAHAPARSVETPVVLPVYTVWIAIFILSAYAKPST